MKLTKQRVMIIKKGNEENGTSIRVYETDKGERFIAEKDLKRAAKRLGCNLNQTRLHPNTGYAIGTGRLPVKRVEPYVLTETAVIGATFFDYN